MAKSVKLQEVAVDLLRPYERNAKKHPAEQIEKIGESIGEFGFLTPCIIDANYNIIAGHGRVLAAKEIGLKSVPCVFIEGLSEEQRRAYILADNRLGDLGEWDMDVAWDEIARLDASGFNIDVTGFDIPDQQADWFEKRERFDQSREEGNEEYNAFLDKFEQPKTTDDCYTPDNIYEVVSNYVANRYGINRSNFVRPFYPGGDYQSYKYKSTDVVVDNPPFSILAQIIDFYLEQGRSFFLFAPALTIMNYAGRIGVTTVCAYAGITYENGASVSTSFVTNMEAEDIAAMTAPELHEALDEENKINEKEMRKEIPKYDYPFEVLTAAKMGYLSKYGQRLEVRRADSTIIRALDAQKEYGKGIYGAALLLSERAAAERAAAERDGAMVWELSERELKIVKALGKEASNG